jgi:hypothetical protein
MNPAVIFGLVRHVLTLAGGYFVAKGQLDPETAETIIGAIATLIGAGWSITSKKAA